MDTKQQMMENAAEMVEIIPSLAEDREYKYFQRTFGGLSIFQRDYKSLLALFVDRYGWQKYESMETKTERKVAVFAEMGIEAVPASWDNGTGHVIVDGKEF
jgi:hypothetical protein